MTRDYDAIVLGSGVNSLVAAARLAKSGLDVAILSDQQIIDVDGPNSDHIAGYTFNIGALDLGLFEDRLISKLALKEFGIQPLISDIHTYAPQLKGIGLSLWNDPLKSRKSITRFSKNDAAIFESWIERMALFASLLSKVTEIAPISLAYAPPHNLMQWAKVAFNLRRLGRKNMMEFLRVLPMGLTRLLNESFESESLKGLLLLPGVRDLYQGPRAAGTTLNFLYHLIGAEKGQIQRSLVIKGGKRSLLEALKKRCLTLNVKFLSEATSYQVEIKNYRTQGIKLSNGEKITAKVVVSGLEARRTFLGHVDASHLEPKFIKRLLAYKLKGSTATILLALTGLPNFSSSPSEEELFGSIMFSPSLDYAERAFDAAKYGEISPNPVLEARIPSLLDPSLAPAGQHSMIIQYRYAPYDLRGNNWDSMKKTLLSNALKSVENYAPGFTSLVSASRVVTPLDYEQIYGFTHGSLSQGQMSLDQLLLMRPVPGFSGYQSPIDGLYLCGPSSHPGGGGSGMPGWNAALQVIREI